MEERCNNFAKRAKADRIFNQIIKFFQFQKERVGKGAIKAATLRNFIKSLKAFCDCADLDINWKKITKGLPKARQAANDRAPTLEEIRKIVEYPDRQTPNTIQQLIDLIQLYLFLSSYFPLLRLQLVQSSNQAHNARILV